MIRVAVVYAATAFAVLQAADIMVLAWALEVTPEGIRVTEAVPEVQARTPALLGKRTLIVAGLLALH